ncbi:hypothetical protein ACT4S2_17040 [Kocuria turfanensis]|uniref:hypothetical protein n=1 Tax=Kocuria turfanensis TaxID=388357 RepID=UPI0040360C54
MRRTVLTLVGMCLVLAVGGATFLSAQMSVRTPFDAWWRHLQLVERQLGRLDGVDRAVLTVETPYWVNRSLHGAWPPRSGTLDLRLDDSTDQDRLLQLLPKAHRLIAEHDWPIHEGHRVGPEEGPDEVTFPVDPATWEVVVSSGPDRLETTEGPLSVLPLARQWTNATRDATDRLETSFPVGNSSATLIGYRDVDLASEASVQDFLDARRAMHDEVQLIGRQGNTTVLAEAPTGMGRVTAADIVAGARLGSAGGIRTLDIGYGGEDGRLSFWAETRDEFGQLSNGPLPESTLTTAAELHELLAGHRVRHTIIVAVPGHAHTWPAQIEEGSE